MEACDDDACDEKPWLNEPCGAAPASRARNSSESANAKWADFNMVRHPVKS
jgi:hypothetical protein